MSIERAIHMAGEVEWDAVWSWCRQTTRGVARVIVGLLGELSDERAYARHLAAHGRRHSGEEWRRFSEARLGAKYLRPKCC